MKLPSSSASQHRLFEAIAHDPKFADKVGIPRAVGADFIRADKRAHKYASGGPVEQALHTAHRLAAGGWSGGFGSTPPGGDDAYGIVQSSVPGRTDRHNVDLPSGSYVLPADVVSGLGEGNSLAGAAVIHKYLSTGPWGTQLPGMGHGHGPPNPPSGYDSTNGSYVMHDLAAGMYRAAGGRTEHSKKVPAVIAGGEFVIPPRVIAYHPDLGGGDMQNSDPKHFKKALNRGHQVLDEFVKQQRAKTIKEMKKLPGPAK